jgi:hypothetical protein
MNPDLLSSNRGRSVLFVHGRDFKPGQDALSQLTLEALRVGIGRDYPDCLPAFNGLRCEFAYYGDLSNEFLRAEGRQYDESLDLGDRKNALRQLSKIPVRKRFGIRQYDRLPGKSAVPEFCVDFIVPVFCWFGLCMPIIRSKARDFAAYLKRDSDYSRAVSERVRSSVCKALDRGDELMLITHGTGSVIAYDVLWELSHDPKYKERYGDVKLDTWVTMGSPLGDRRIRKRLVSAGKAGKELFPTNVIHWHNISAEDDYTCHDKTLADDFKKMLRQQLVSAVTDYLVFNHAVRYGRSNPHSSVGYYVHPRLAKIVVDWINEADAE